METIDYSYQCFRCFLDKAQNVLASAATEQDTRMKIINPLFVDVLGWDKHDILTEENTGAGFTDYTITVNTRARLVVEAKKPAVDFGIHNKTSGKAFKLSGPVFSNDNVANGIDQAIRYCGRRNCELACVTNAREWVIFRGSRLGDGLNTLDGYAFIFSDLEGVADNYALFHNLLSCDGVSNYKYRAHFQEVEGQPIRPSDFSQTILPPDSHSLLTKGDLSRDLDEVMTLFFRRLSGDDDADMLAECFVTTPESEAAEEYLARVSEDLISSIRSLDTDTATALTSLIEKVKSIERNEFVLLVGTKGAGKSTFIKRFFQLILPDALVSECVKISVNLGDSDGDEMTVLQWLNRTLISTIEKEVFGGAPSYDELQGMFFDEYKRWLKGPYAHLYETDKTQFKIEFGKHIDELRTDQDSEYVVRMLRRIASSRKKLPCLIVDNADHFSIEFQEKVFQYVRSLYEQCLCLVLMPITDKTSWQLSNQGALQSFDSQSLFLPTPTPRRVLERRISFLRTKTGGDKHEGHEDYFFGKGIKLSLSNLRGFTVCLEEVFLNTGSCARWIESLANHDVRRCLSLARDIATSAHLKVNDLLSAYIAKSSIELPPQKIQTAIIKKDYTQYPVGQHEFVQNIYSLTTEVPTSPLMGLRLLRLLADSRYDDVSGSEAYVNVSQVSDYFYAMGVERRVTTIWLEALLKTGLCLSYDPTVTSITGAKKIQIAPAGEQHLSWGQNDWTYMRAMMPVTPIHNRTVFNKIDSIKDWKWMRRLIAFIDYLLAEDDMFINVPAHEAYPGQRRVTQRMKQCMKTLRDKDKT